MSWFSNPKVRLALIVNGLYFISLFTTTTQPHKRSRIFARDYSEYELRDARAESKRPPIFAALPPPSGPSKATTWVNKEHDQLDVYLTNDLTLVRKPGYRLLLSPTFTTRASDPEAPDTVLLRFISYADKETPSDPGWLTITADGRNMWHENLSNEYSRNIVRRADTEEDKDNGGKLVNTAGINLPYNLFVETISARQVIVQFGPDRVELTAEQIEALRDMHRRLPQPPPPDEKGGITYDLKSAPHAGGTGIGPKR